MASPSRRQARVNPRLIQSRVSFVSADYCPVCNNDGLSLSFNTFRCGGTSSILFLARTSLERPLLRVVARVAESREPRISIYRESRPRYVSVRTLRRRRYTIPSKVSGSRKPHTPTGRPNNVGGLSHSYLRPHSSSARLSPSRLPSSRRCQ